MNGEKIKRIEYSTKYLRSFKKLSEEIKEKANEKEAYFKKDPFDPRLKSHKLGGKFQEYWSYSVDYKYRVIFNLLSGGEALFFDIGLHPIYEKGE
jgi:mRNA-degrading endonuclease YafQ of YafQ-DinJ toxin-antitoxin module